MKQTSGDGTPSVDRRSSWLGILSVKYSVVKKYVAALTRKQVIPLVIVLYLCALGGFTANYDFTRSHLVGDMASHVLQALSIAKDCDLRFDERDMVNWNELEWRSVPHGLFFQIYKGGYAFAKPYGYSLFLSPFVVLLGKHGFVLGNAVIFSILCLLAYLTLRSAYKWREAALLTAAFSLFSYTYMYVFFIHSDLFLAMLTMAILLLISKAIAVPKTGVVVLLAILSAFLLSE
jgi:hypothetical protein